MEIDAPEKNHPHGKNAKQALSDLVYGKEITVEVGGRDRYQRTLAHLKLDHLDINREMVKLGYAWCYRQYLKDKSCLSDEESARDERLGLWSDPDPEPPWACRHGWRERWAHVRATPLLAALAVKPWL